MEIFRTRRQYPAAPPEIEKDDKKGTSGVFFKYRD